MISLIFVCCMLVLGRVAYANFHLHMQAHLDELRLVCFIFSFFFNSLDACLGP